MDPSIEIGHRFESNFYLDLMNPDDLTIKGLGVNTYIHLTFFTYDCWTITMNLEQLWTDLQQEIKEILGVNKYEIWVQKGDDVKLQLVDSGDTWILFETNNDYFAKHVEKHVTFVLYQNCFYNCGHPIGL